MSAPSHFPCTAKRDCWSNVAPPLVARELYDGRRLRHRRVRVPFEHRERLS